MVKLFQSIAMSIGVIGAGFLICIITILVLGGIHSVIVALLLKSPPGEEPDFKELDNANANAIGIMIIGGLFLLLTYAFYISE